MIDVTSLEMEEILKLDRFIKRGRVMRQFALFFDPSGGTLYAEHCGTLYKWDLQTNGPGPEWWIGE